MDDADVAVSLRREMVWTFNLAPATYCHPSWLPPGLPDSESRHGDGDRYLNHWLLASYRLGERFSFDFENPLRRLVLLDCEALERVSLVFGLLSKVGALRKTLDRETLSRVRAASRIEELGFVVMSDLGLPQDLHPDEQVFDDDALVAMPLVGARLLLKVAADGDAAMAMRARIKFPKKPSLVSDEDSELEFSSARLAAWMIRECIPRVVPSWKWLFC